MSGVNIDHVKPRLFRAQRGAVVPATEGLDIRLVHCARRIGLTCQIWHRFDIHGYQPRHHIGRPPAAIPKLCPRERSIFMHCIRHQRVRAHVTIIPKRRRRVRQVIRCGMDGIVLGVHHRPPPFGLHPSHRGQGARAHIAHAGAMGHLIEPVARRHRPDFDRFKQDVVTGISGHGFNRLERRHVEVIGKERGKVGIDLLAPV